MNYIYDIVLNFHESYYEFYEWKSTDKIINFKNGSVSNVIINEHPMNIEDIEW